MRVGGDGNGNVVSYASGFHHSPLAGDICWRKIRGLKPEPVHDARSTASIRTNLPLWKTFVSEVHAVIDAADAADRATPAMEQAGITALNSGAADPGGLVHKIWLAMSAIRGT